MSQRGLNGAEAGPLAGDPLIRTLQNRIKSYTTTALSGFGTSNKYLAEFGVKTEKDGFIIFGRSDATLNPGGVRIGTAEIYRQVEQIEEVLEGLVVGQIWKGDTRVVLFVRLKPKYDLTQDLITKIKTKIKTGASPRHVPSKIIVVNDSSSNSLPNLFPRL